MCVLIKILYPSVLDLLQVVGVINNCQSFVSYSNFSFYLKVFCVFPMKVVFTKSCVQMTDSIQNYKFK